MTDPGTRPPPELESLALRYTGGRLLVLDQRRLPFTENWVHCRSPAEMCDIIRTLQVRGAPLIGIAAALSLADYALMGASPSAVREAARALLESRPTGVNLRNALDRLVFSGGALDAGTLAEKAGALFREDVVLCDRMAAHGASLIGDGDSILTHCNTGSLVTAGVGTALGAIKRAHEQGKTIHVYVDETRPLLQGARLTAWELRQAGVPHTLICDGAAGALMSRGKIDKVMLGADRIARNGDVANKIGTYGLAVLAAYHRLPFYVVAPYTTVDFACEGGDQIPIEARCAEEIRGFDNVAGGTGSVCWAAPETPALNPAFDVTPASLVSAVVLDAGVFSREQLREKGLDGLLGNRVCRSPQ